LARIVFRLGWLINRADNNPFPEIGRSWRRVRSRRLHLLNKETSNDLEKSEKSLGVSGSVQTTLDCLLEAVSVASFAPTIGYIADWRLCPDRTLVAVRANAPVAGMPPKNGDALSHKLDIGIMLIAAHSIGDYRRQQRFDCT